ncbi:hypothetical protein H0X10_02250 [Candidatus Saccharibacteria bacterium]|nr:hypothetical protein [Candidatus Saccharibacteria bacterium]
MPSASKDTVYIDIDDEITTIIDKVKSSDKKIVALVLPKRAATLQSIVNMKLLKRVTDDAKKNIVLITSETSLLPLAGAVGLHVAKTLQSKPAIPAAPITADTPISVNQDDIDDVELDPAKPVGQLADEEEAIEVDNEDKPEALAAAATTAKGASKKKIRIPNFNKFRLRIVLGVLALILLIVGYVFAFMVLPKAKVVIKTDSNSIDTELTLTARPSATEINEEQLIVPAINKELKKTETEKVAATGQLDKGMKASGTVTLQNCSPQAGDVTIPAGTGVSTANFTFITQAAVTLDESSFTGTQICKTATEQVGVTAQNAGDQYNISGDRTFTVAGFSGVKGVDSSAMSGGTTSIVKVVAQKDIDDAKQKIADRSNAVKDELKADLETTDYYALQDTFAGGAPAITSTPNVNDEASEVTVSSTTTYTMTGVKKDDLKELIAKSVDSKIDKSKQVLLDDGLGNANVSILAKEPNGDVRFVLKTQALAGPQLDENAIKQEIAGKKKNQASNAIKSRPGINDVEISYSPFWVSSTPKKTSKITVIFEQKADDNADNKD